MNRENRAGTISFQPRWGLRSNYEQRDYLISYQGVWQLWVSVRDLAPRRWNIRSTAKLVPIEWPDSTVIRLPIRPEAWTAEISGSETWNMRPSEIFGRRSPTTIAPERTPIFDSNLLDLETSRFSEKMLFISNPDSAPLGPHVEGLRLKERTKPNVVVHYCTL